MVFLTDPMNEDEYRVAITLWLKEAIASVGSAKALCDQADINYRTLMAWLSPEGARLPGGHALIKIAHVSGWSLDQLALPQSAKTKSVDDFIAVMDRVEEHLEQKGYKSVQPRTVRKITEYILKKILQEQRNTGKSVDSKTDINVSDYENVIDFALSQ